MPNAYTSFFSYASDTLLQLPAGVQTSLFSFFSSAAILLVLYLVFFRRTEWMGQLGQSLRNLMADLRGTKFEARLNKVVCYHCNKGMGLYNPSYFLSHGEQHVQGTCNLCGGFVRVRMR